MSDSFYRFVCAACRPALWLTSRPIALHADRIPATGAFILAPNHTSPFDVPCLMRSVARPIDFLSIVEMQRKPFVGRLYRRMNCIFIDRRRADLTAVRAMRSRLAAARIVAMFPEGNIRSGGDAVTHGGAIKPGVLKLAAQTGVPIIPCVMINTAAHLRPVNWLPFQRWAYGINVGEPIHVADSSDEELAKLKNIYVQLFAELEAYAGRSIHSSSRIG